MIPKLVLVIGPLVLYGAICAVLALRGRAPARFTLNVHLSLLLLVYLLGTAGLGIFLVANQQLPVFDWHYLMGYATLALVGMHLFFNLPVVARWFGKRQGRASSASSSPVLGKAAAMLLALGVAFYVGQRQSGGELRAVATAVPANAVVQYHAWSSESRASVFQRAPGVAWGDAPPPFKDYPQAATVTLAKGAPRGESLGAMLAAPAAQARVTLAELGRMLHLASGITERRGGHALRAAPSSGALFPSELYVAARRIAGLAPGLYHYDPRRHRLNAIGALPASLGAPDADDAEAVVVLSAVFRRTGYKYHNRAYRYALADAGHLLENLRLAAHAGGLSPALLPRFDDGVAARALAIDGVEEGVLAMMALRASGSAAACGAAPCAPQRFVPVLPVAGTPLGVTGMIHQATSLRQAGQGGAIALPPAQAAPRDLYSTITARRSERRYASEPVALAALANVLAGMQQKTQLFDGIQISIVVNRVAGLAPGVYRYLPQHALRQVAAGDLSAAARSAALSQDVIGDAAAVLVLSTTREAVLAAGTRGYRHALIEAGLIGERWLLGAVAQSLAACPVGAFYDDEAAALIGEDAASHWVLHFAALGERSR